MGELHSRVLAALDEATNKNQSQQSLDDNEGFFSVFMRALKSDTSQGSDFDRNAEEGKLVSYLKQTSELMSKIVKVSNYALYIKRFLNPSCNPQYQNANSPSLFPYVLYRSSGKKLLNIISRKFILHDQVLNS